jgi:hypothetical protein
LALFRPRERYRYRWHLYVPKGFYVVLGSTDTQPMLLHPRRRVSPSESLPSGKRPNLISTRSPCQRRPSHVWFDFGVFRTARVHPYRLDATRLGLASRMCPFRRKSREAVLRGIARCCPAAPVSWNDHPPMPLATHSKNCSFPSSDRSPTRWPLPFVRQLIPAASVTEDTRVRATLS